MKMARLRCAPATEQISDQPFMEIARKDVVIIGAGLSGLVCAYRLKRLGLDVLLVENSERAGGVIRSEKVDGFLIERGPNSAQGSEELLALVEELGITDELIEGDSKAPAYVYFNGGLHAVPMSPPAFLKSTLLGFGGKLRVLAEPFIAGRRSDGEESVASFVRRRIGGQAAERLVAPFVSGIYAGDAEKLSVQAAFPRLANLENNYGGLFRGMIAKAREAKAAKKASALSDEKPKPQRKRICSFRQGMSFLTETLAARIGEELITGCSDLRISDLKSEISNDETRKNDDLRFQISNSKSQIDDCRFAIKFTKAGGDELIICKDMIIATPAFIASKLVAPLSSELEGLLSEIEYPPLSIAHLAYDRTEVGHDLKGFGFLATPSANLKILGCVWNTSLFEGRAPSGKVMMTVFIGGARHPELARLADAELAAAAHSELQRILNVSDEPQIISITRYSRAIPQYNLGHAERVRNLEKRLGKIPGLHLAGNYLKGVSTGDCIKEADHLARETCKTLRAAE
jgi:oxygen-dependent protoporphyrinogen oxidase